MFVNVTCTVIIDGFIGNYWWSDLKSYYCECRGTVQSLLSSEHLVVIHFFQDEHIACCQLEIFRMIKFWQRFDTKAYNRTHQSSYLKAGECIRKGKSSMKLWTWLSFLSNSTVSWRQRGGPTSFSAFKREQVIMSNLPKPSFYLEGNMGFGEFKSEDLCSHS